MILGVDGAKWVDVKSCDDALFYRLQGAGLGV